MIQRFQNNPNLSYFLLYSFTYIFYGAIIAAPGPVIPFLAKKYDIPQTEFTTFFFYRSTGFITGSIAIKLLSQRFSHHTILGVGAILAAIPHILFPFFDSVTLQGYCIFVSSIFCAIFEIIISICVLEAHRGNNEEFWLQICHGTFGLGGILGPIFIGVLQINGMLIIGVGMLLGFPGYFYLKSSEGLETAGDTKQNPSQNTKEINSLTTYMLMFIFFIYFGEETGFAGWISSYVVLENLDTEKGASKFPAIFWISITLFRFLFAGLPGKITYKLKVLISLQTFCYVVTILLVNMDYKYFAAYWSSFLVGLAYSSLYALFYTIPIQFNQKPNESQTANFLMCGSLGEGILTTLIGYLMKLFGPQMMFWFMLATGVISYLMVILISRELKRNAPETQTQYELKQRLNK